MTSRPTNDLWLWTGLNIACDCTPHKRQLNMVQYGLFLKQYRKRSRLQARSSYAVATDKLSYDYHTVLATISIIIGEDDAWMRSLV
jgi:hypothetical protein